jgi:hypothetical protein
LNVSGACAAARAGKRVATSTKARHRRLGDIKPPVE